jgi:hypothetical protein
MFDDDEFTSAFRDRPSVPLFEDDNLTSASKDQPSVPLFEDDNLTSASKDQPSVPLFEDDNLTSVSGSGYAWHQEFRDNDLWEENSALNSSWNQPQTSEASGSNTAPAPATLIGKGKQRAGEFPFHFQTAVL